MPRHHVPKGRKPRPPLTIIQQRLVDDNRAFVWHLAPIFADRGVSHEDLISAGYLGLCEAARRYRPELGFRFTTYAGRWIKQHMILEIQDRRVVVVPRGKRHGYCAEAQREALARRERSLSHADRPRDLPDDRMPSPYDDEDVQMAWEAMADLPQSWREVLDLLLQGKNRVEIGKLRGVSRERIRYIEAKAIGFIRRRMGLEPPADTSIRRERLWVDSLVMRP